jgi:hypothetical protein
LPLIAFDFLVKWPSWQPEALETLDSISKTQKHTHKHICTSSTPWNSKTHSKHTPNTLQTHSQTLVLYWSCCLFWLFVLVYLYLLFFVFVCCCLFLFALLCPWFSIKKIFMTPWSTQNTSQHPKNT